MTSEVRGTGLLAGSVAVVTGGVGVIGRAVALRMASHGAHVAVADLDQVASQAVATDIATRTGVAAVGVGVDVTDRASLDAAMDTVEKKLGVVDVSVVNAGRLLAQDTLEMSVEQWQSVLEVNLTGAMLTAQTAARRLRAVEKPGSIIVMSSLFGLRGGRGNGAYSASKFGVIGLVQTMASELAAFGIRVNAVCPGQIDSAMLSELLQRRAEESNTSEQYERDQFVHRIPLGRLGSPEEVADGCVYLASPLSSYVTGHSLLIDGGWQVG